MARTLLIGLGAALFTGAVCAFAQVPLPVGPGRAETVKACNTCHGLDIFQNIRRSAIGWETTVANMVAAGAPMSDEEFDTVVAYLATYLGLSPPPAAGRVESGMPAPPVPVPQP